MRKGKTPKSIIYSPSIRSEISDIPTPIIASSPLSSEILPLDFDLEPETERHIDNDPGTPGELLAYDNPIVGEPQPYGNTYDQPLSPLLLQESHGVLSLPPDQPTIEQQGHTRSPILARYVRCSFFSILVLSSLARCVALFVIDADGLGHAYVRACMRACN
jgi:hypothetical protein